MKSPPPSPKALAAADAKADATGQRAAQAKKALKLAKLRYRSAKKAVKQARRVSRKAAKLARKAKRRLGKIREEIAKAEVETKSPPDTKPPMSASARDKR